jgi:hypothetical protein
MAPPLPPTVGERLVKCETSVDVWGILNGADVDLLINGNTVQTQNNVKSWGTSFTLGVSLTPGQAVTARQSLGGQPSAESPVVVVGDVDLPPPPPRLAPSIYRCSNCVFADGMAPGSTITVFQGGGRVAALPRSLRPLPAETGRCVSGQEEDLQTISRSLRLQQHAA